MCALSTYKQNKSPSGSAVTQCLCNTMTQPQLKLSFEMNEFPVKEGHVQLECANQRVSVCWPDNNLKYGQRVSASRLP